MKTLKEMIDQHALWLAGTPGGVRADFSRRKFEFETIVGANLRNCIMLEGSFSHCVFKDVSFKGAIIKDVTFKSCRFNIVDFKCETGIQTKVERCNFMSCQFIQVCIKDALWLGNRTSSSDGIFSAGPMPTSGRIVTAMWQGDRWLVKAGCFWGSIQDLRTAVYKAHACRVYLKLCDLLDEYKPDFL